MIEAATSGVVVIKTPVIAIRLNKISYLGRASNDYAVSEASRSFLQGFARSTGEADLPSPAEGDLQRTVL